MAPIMLRKSEKDFVKELKSSRSIESLFVVSDKVIKTGKSGFRYIDVTLSDKTGTIVGRFLSGDKTDEIYASIKTGVVSRIIGTVEEFRGSFSIKLDKIEVCPEGEYDIDDFKRVSEKDRDELIAKIESTIDQIQNEDLKSILHVFFSDAQFKREFYEAPSAKKMHHNYAGGLLEHTVEVLNICETTCEIFPELDRDLLYTGAILHDVGKLRTYDYGPLSIEISEEGDLLEHLVISYDMIREKMRMLNIPKELSTKLLHVVLSHHGEVKNGWGSPVNPKLPEAIALHHADNLDAKVKGRLQRIDELD
jgi:3'-5' exoribonuclease